jgi:hypothetical protein
MGFDWYSGAPRGRSRSVENLLFVGEHLRPVDFKQTRPGGPDQAVGPGVEPGGHKHNLLKPPPGGVNQEVVEEPVANAERRRGEG